MPSPRLHVELPLAPDTEAVLPAGPARHVQVLRLQPGDALTLFDGAGADWPAVVVAIGRSAVRVRTGAAPLAVDRELPLPVTLALGMPANERMDWLVEKATELGAAAIQPLRCERSVLRLDGERAERKRVHWRGIAAAAAEQCGRARLPEIAPVRALADYLDGLAVGDETPTRWVLSLAADAQPFALALRPALHAGCPLVLLSGPEGGLSAAEEDAARAGGLRPVTLGPRVLRAETAPLAALATLGALFS